MMTGIIWLVQLVHYPSFRYIQVEKAEQFHRFHTDSIVLFVAPLMLIELATAIFLASGLGINGLAVLGLTSLLWASTFLLQVPLHNRLAKEWKPATIDQLITTNWLRTGLWTLKTLILAYWVYYS